MLYRRGAIWRSAACGVIAWMLILASPTWAQPPAAADDELELTMTLLPETATEPESITKNIELPPPASDQGTTQTERGTSQANQDRDSRETGLEKAAEARERGREFGQDAAAEAQQNREDRGRGNAPDRPSPPEHPGPPPNTPGGS